MLEILDSWGSQLHRDVGSENFSFFLSKVQPSEPTDATGLAQGWCPLVCSDQESAGPHFKSQLLTFIIDQTSTCCHILF